MSTPLEVLYEDNHCLAVAKPAGVPSAHYQGTEETLDRTVKRYLKAKYRKPGNVFLGTVHRLDRPVSGVLLFARTSKAAARLAEQFREGRIEKIYWAVVDAPPNPSAAILDDWVKYARAARRLRIVSADELGAQRAVLGYRVLAKQKGVSGLEVRPRTGRRHQIRAQLAHCGLVICGDTRYGSRSAFAPGVIALHARRLTFLHPIRQEPITVTAQLPVDWRPFLPLFPEDPA